jgi:DNA-binding NtrC family response regulator
MADIVIVDDEEKIGKLLAAELGDEGHGVVRTTSPKDALRMVQEKKPDVLITDLRMDGMDGISLLKEAKSVSPGTDVIVMTAYASVETAIAALREGAYDYLIKPFQTEELLMLVTRLEERRRLQSENLALRSYLSENLTEDIVGESPAMKRIKEIIQGLSHSDAAVLIRGESGTGKELVAKAVHKTSTRAEGPFIALNCAAIPESLLESELFGYEKGAFTGAVKRKIGHFQLADNGTLFLDEIGDLPLSLQAKLLRVLETHIITPLGSEKDTKINIRLISATHRPLESAIQDGAFREDLFYRLNVFPITLPPLRDRREDVAGIARHFLDAWGRPIEELSAEALSKLTRYDWPGNIRELRNVLERSTIIRPAGTISGDDILLTDVVPARSGGTPDGVSEPDSILNILDLGELEKRAIAKALDVASGNKSEAARLLGITRRALYGRLERYGID